MIVKALLKAFKLLAIILFRNGFVGIMCLLYGFQQLFITFREN